VGDAWRIAALRLRLFARPANQTWL